MNIQQMMKQAQAMQRKLAEAQEKIAALEVEGSSGGGMVKIAISGKGEAKKVTIDPSVIDPNEKELLEDLLVAALNDARKKLEDQSGGYMNDLTSGMQLPPGFKMPF
jgi:nucleoid-associated protein EbfC